MSLSKNLLLIILACFCFFQLSYAKQLILTEEEHAWLEEHPNISIAHNLNFPPIEWKNDKGEYNGLAVDYIHLIEKKIGIQFKRVEYQNWSKVLKAFKKGNIDVLSAIAENEHSKQYFNFTKYHIEIRGVVVSEKEYKSIDELSGKKIGVVNDNFWDELISQYKDKIEIIRFQNAQSGVNLLLSGVIDAMVTDLASITYFVKEEGIGNFNFVPVPILKKQKLKLSLGIRKDWPMLQTILQKALNSIEKEEKNKIYNQWIRIQEVSFWQDVRFQYNLAIAIFALLSLFIIIIIWNRTLKKEVKNRSEQLKNAHIQLMRAEKMESIGRLAAGVAHEVKNPLAILQMSADYLKGEDNDTSITTILEDMDDAIIRADRVIKGLLDFSREKELQMAFGNINEVIENSLMLIQHELKHHNIQLVVDLSDALPEIVIDKNRLQQVFINLFMNSVQAINAVKEKKEKPEIIIKTKLTVIRDIKFVEQSEGRIKLNQKAILCTIFDTGTGLDEKSEESIFDPFFTTKPLGEGTGLGLSVSKTIINLHHGLITMDNRKNANTKGVKVRIYFAVPEEKEK